MKDSKSMNVVFIISDQHNANFTGYSGGITNTPNIDSIAENGVCFPNAYCASPICVPTRASLFTGRYIHEIRYWDNTKGYNGSPKGWSHYLKENNIHLTTIGKLDFSPNGDFGIEDMRLKMMRHSSDVVALFREQDTVQRRSEIDYYYRIRPRPDNTPIPKVEGGYTDTEITNEAIKWIKNDRPLNSPWVLYIGYTSPHPKWVPMRSLFEKYLNKISVLTPKYLQPIEELHPVDQKNSIHDCAYENETLEKIQIMHAAYHAVIEELDKEIGKILVTLDEVNIREKTLIIYTSDHGEMVRAHGKLGKMSMYEDSIRIPLIISGPGLLRGHVEKSIVSQIDIFPTICEALNLKQPHFSRGRSLLPLAKGEMSSFTDRVAFCEFHANNYQNGAFVIRKGNWKFIEYLNYRPALYDLDNDPDEMFDLVLHKPDEPETKKQIQYMREILHNICSPMDIDKQAKEDQRKLRAEMTASGQLAEELYVRGFERNTERLIPRICSKHKLP